MNSKIPEKRAQELIIKEAVKKRVETRGELESLKRKIIKGFDFSFPSNIDLLETYHRLVKNRRIKKTEAIEKMLITRPIRSLSGIVNLSVLTKPYPCPGRCLYCPNAKGFPKSYLAGEPAADRAKFLNFDPYLQVKKRLEALKDQGHPTDKIELRIAGGTWSYYPQKYQSWFIRRCFEATNNHKSSTLLDAQKINEEGERRIVGLSVETRPDFITLEEVKRLRRLGITLVELGAQTVFDDVLKKCQTGSSAAKITRATQLLKDAGFKILYQVMPNLPGSNLKKDFQLFQLLFTDNRFKPDWLKIYPCLICPGTKLLKLWQKKEYRPYSEKELINLLIKIKKNLPCWVRITRIFRDIPRQSILAGCQTSNLREVIKREMERKNLTCSCIRCREVKEKYDEREKLFLFREDYEASEGKEIFLSLENKKRTKLYSLLRLRVPHKKNKPIFSVLKNSALIRELQTFGQQVPLRPSSLRGAQHKGLGKKLMEEAEKIAKEEFGLKKMAAISGIGARGYYQKLGYRLKETYMIKKLK